MQTFRRWWNSLPHKQRYIILSLGSMIIIGSLGGSAYAWTMRQGSSNIGDRTKEVIESHQGSIDPTQPIETAQTPPPPVVPKNRSPLSGRECERHNARPIGVMMAGDTVARPLSGLSEAEIVVEMPVITGSVTRLMAVYVCNIPTQVGSVRSARHDFISFIRGWDGIFVHWGGSHFALDELKSGIRYTGENLGKVPDVDALTANGPFFRQNFARPPHNGFASLPKVIEFSTAKQYSLDNTFSGYPFYNEEELATAKESAKVGTVSVGFAGAYRTAWEYNLEYNHYVRYWAGKKDSDRNTGQDVTTSNIVVMKASSRQIEGQYNTVDIYGEGEATIYQNGQEVKGSWKKPGFKDTVRFYTADGKEIKLVPGSTFIQVIEPNQSSTWQ